MIEEEAIVTYSDKLRIRFKPAGKSGCGACLHHDRCGTSAIAKFMPKREFEADNCEDLRVGDNITVAIDESKLLFGSLLLYLVPLISMIAAVIVANRFLPSALLDQWLPVIAFAALLLPFYLIHRLQTYLLVYFWREPQISTQTNRR